MMFLSMVNQAIDSSKKFSLGGKLFLVLSKCIIQNFNNAMFQLIHIVQLESWRIDALR